MSLFSASSLRPLLLLASLLAGTAQAVDTHPATRAPAATAAPGPVWEARMPDFSDASYRAAVEKMLQDYEIRTGRRLAPGARHKVGLKIYSDSGPGLATPYGLTRAVIAAMESRGFQQKDIFLVGLNAFRLRLTGYLPTAGSSAAAFPDHPVFVLESGRFYDPVWFYDSPLPARFDPLTNERAVEAAAAGKSSTTLEEDRKSFLATPLFLEADFWINLPVYTDHPVLGVNGALVNATLWNASNTFRFFRSPATAPPAVAEMAAIPELRERWVLTISSLQLYQFIGGPYFNSLYTVSEPVVWMSTDPVIMDSLMLQRINDARKRAGFEPVTEEESRLLEFAQQLGVGHYDVAKVPWIRLGR